MQNVELEEEIVIISQGAESRIYETTYNGQPVICKERLKKSYRVKVLDDKINKQRLVQEARCLERCHKAGIPVPIVYHTDTASSKLYMEKIVGPTLKNFLWNNSTAVANAHNMQIAQDLGKVIAMMHDREIIHGDLTTSNFVLRLKEDEGKYEVLIIDFGLGMVKASAEEKAVDLYVLERAFISTHPSSEEMVQAILQSYQTTSKKATATMQKLEQVRQRGRKRDMIG